MNDKSQAAPKVEQEDLLEQIITQGLDRIKSPVRAAVTETPAEEKTPASKRADSSGSPPSLDRKNRRSAVYLYLLVLFGAAFLMLLLAYFVQRRSSEDLRDSMNLSREELLDEIRDLKEQNAALDEKISLLNDELAHWQTLYEEKAQDADELLDQNTALQVELHDWKFFWTLEQYYQEGDYESCAAILLLLQQGQFTVPNNTQERNGEILQEIVQAVIDAGILDEDYQRHPDDYKDLLDAYLAG